MKTEEREQKERIQNHICRFQTGDFMTNAESLFTTLGYASDRRVKIDKDYLCNKGLNQEKALFSDWREAGLLYQVTGEDLSNQGFLFEIKFDIDRMQSYLFYAIELEPKIYQRGKLAQITREVNKLFPMPVFILFKYGNRLTFSIIDRRQHKRDESKDVLEKVTLIKDISIANPHRAHIEILYDLSYPELLTNFRFSNFEGLHKAWQKTLDTKELNKKFYRELSAWYFYAKQNVLFPDDVEKDADKRNSINLIRLITRLIFVWFVKEKGLVPEELFDEDFLRGILNYSDKTGSTYYKAILQNLFFATLNLEMNKDKPDSRKFVEREDGFHSDQHLQAAYRYVRFFKEPDKALTLFENIPFLNGGLFENLDFEITKDGKREIRRIDCFSDHPQNETRLKVPDELFFSDLQKVDLSAVYEDNKKRSEEFRGIINIFKRYKFTIEENTPIEEEIALDPELLGKVFENLLASYNPETHTTARKATGSFYTPREIVNYMVDESLVAYLETQLKEQVPEFKEMDTLGELLRDTLSYTEKEHPFTKAEEIDALINAIDNCKILDPACGSGAFPMGILHKLVYLLHKLDPQNEKWMQRQIERVQSAIREAEKVEDTAIRDHLLHDLETNIESIEDAFLNNELDYGRKLYLIENCIYGVDIQPIAIQIAKLRFFISLVIDQKVDPAKPNLNIRALPNLETKFVAANTLIGLEKPAQITLRNPRIDRLEIELKEVRKKHFNARTRREKKQLRAKDEELRNKIAELLIGDRWSDKSARQLADWNPYDQNTSSPFFDPEWMFGIANGFDIVIGNPPYLESRHPDFNDDLKELYQASTKRRWKEDVKYVTRGSDLLIYFFENAIFNVNHNGCIILITQNSWLDTEYGKKFQNFLLKNTQVRLVIDSDFRYFASGDGPNINAVITLFIGKNSKSLNTITFARYHASFGQISNLIDQEDSPFVDTNKYAYTNNLLQEVKWGILLSSSKETLALFDLLRKKASKIEDIKECRLSFGQGLNLSKDYLVDSQILSAFPYARKAAIPLLTSDDGAVFNIQKTARHILDKTKLTKQELQEIKAKGIIPFDLNSTSKKPPKLIMPRGISTHFCAFNPIGCYSSSCVDLYDIANNAAENILLNLWLFFNSSLFWLLREISGRKNLGGGLLKSEAVDLESMHVYMDFQNTKEIKKLLEKLSKRQALVTVDEIDTDEHRQIDDIVFDYLSLEESERINIISTLKQKITDRKKKAST